MRRPVTLQTLLSGSKLHPPVVGSLQDTNLDLSKFPVSLFLCELLFLPTCPLDARQSTGLATQVASCSANSVGMFCLELGPRRSEQQVLRSAQDDKFLGASVC